MMSAGRSLRTPTLIDRLYDPCIALPNTVDRVKGEIVYPVVRRHRTATPVSATLKQVCVHQSRSSPVSPLGGNNCGCRFYLCLTPCDRPDLDCCATRPDAMPARNH